MHTILYFYVLEFQFNNKYVLHKTTANLIFIKLFKFFDCTEILSM